MLFGLQICVCGLFLLAAIFYGGKKLGERKFFKMQHELKAYETSFNQLLEQMELVSNHNLKVLETKTEELRDLIPVVDKKLLYAGDLIGEIDAVKRDISVRYGHLRTSPIPVSETKLKREVLDMLDEVGLRIQSVEQRLKHLEVRDHEETMHMEKRERQKERESAVASEKIISLKALDVSFKGETFTAKDSPSVPEKITKLHPCPVLELAPAKTVSSMLPKPGSIFQEVLDLREKGFSLPQIGRQLNIDYGEVEVIMNIYGSKPSLRKVT